MPLKKASGLGAALQPLDVNQETFCEARNQKRKATTPTSQEEELDQEIRDLKGHPSTGSGEEGKDALSRRSSEED
jgi:hypothetical protein